MARTFDADHPTPRGRTRDGALLAVSFVASSAGEVHLEDVRVVPTWTENTPDRVVIRTHAALRTTAPELVAARSAEITAIVAPALLADDLDW
jgi:hypothetical protein